jgi:hypothetical protein
MHVPRGCLYVCATGGSHVPSGMYAAGFLGTVARAAPDVGLLFTNYFEPVNEGAVQVGGRR